MLNLPISTGTEFSIRWSSGVDQSCRSSEIVPYYTGVGIEERDYSKRSFGSLYCTALLSYICMSSDSD
jgi:hypothetical protein